MFVSVFSLWREMAVLQKNVCELIAVRHGETTCNAAGIMQVPSFCSLSLSRTIYLYLFIYMRVYVCVAFIMFVSACAHYVYE